MTRKVAPRRGLTTFIWMPWDLAWEIAVCRSPSRRGSEYPSHSHGVSHVVATVIAGRNLASAPPVELIFRFFLSFFFFPLPSSFFLTA